MRVAIVNTASLFIRGGAEILVDDLAAQLNARGHEATIFRVPFPMDFGKPLIHLIEASKMLRFDGFDRVIAHKFPAYCISHPGKVVWMFHQFRQVYELWNMEFGMQAGPEANALKGVVMNADESLRNARHLYTNAQEVSRRLMDYNGIASEVLIPPLLHSERYYCAEAEDYIFYPSRINSFKRQLLAVQAMAYVKTDAKLRISGICESIEYDTQIKAAINSAGLQKKVCYENRWITDEEKYAYMAKCLGALYIPYKEDSQGFVTMEAFYSSKPVISCVDSGGTVGFIEDNATGYFSQPDPKSLAACMDAMYRDRDKTRRMGETAREDILGRNINWDETIRRLLA